MSDTIIDRLSLDRLREQFQHAGYRVEALTDPAANLSYLRSATNGIAFDIRPGNMLPGDEQVFVDVALIAVLHVQGEMPLDLVNRWNATRRFARLQFSPPFLALSLDISVAGGVSPTHVRGQIEIWDQLVQQLVSFLREEIAALAKPKQADDAQTATTPASANGHIADAGPAHPVQ
ncbi:YbjN domain-containing protein [Bradyrhizobium ontarionense]|uniref:YbjN domain-containing protein n=1 Tax=Bradyrhizobium ontarionense TaxID=2898149 RepID=A0ABY3R7M7_9BRAD|nr:YbjN domain-containing protein [Bradyrhizobium sp. A19]UFZ03335.1 YbjN domain-containing protein [Bradyrhizobium sp. A19]